MTAPALPKRTTFEMMVAGLLGDMFWKSIIYDRDDSGNITFKGCHGTLDALQNDSDWYIWKYENAGQDRVRTQGPITGSWDDRKTLDWDYSPVSVTAKFDSNIELSDTYGTFGDILKELKKITWHLSLLTDVLITNREVE